jgi:hypothetical protein
MLSRSQYCINIKRYFFSATNIQWCRRTALEVSARADCYKFFIFKSVHSGLHNANAVEPYYKFILCAYKVY